MITTKEKNLELHTTAVMGIGRTINSMAGEPEILDMSTENSICGKWSQEKFKTMFTVIVTTASIIRECKNRMFVSALVSPDVATAIQSISSCRDNSDRDYIVDVLVGAGASVEELDAFAVLNKFVTVYVDMFATESYSCVFATDHSDIDNTCILEEFPNLIVPPDLLVVKNVYVGLNKYFGNAFPDIPA